MKVDLSRINAFNPKSIEARTLLIRRSVSPPPSLHHRPLQHTIPNKHPLRGAPSSSSVPHLKRRNQTKRNHIFPSFFQQNSDEEIQKLSSIQNSSLNRYVRQVLQQIFTETTKFSGTLSIIFRWNLNSSFFFFLLNRISLENDFCL